MTRQERKKLAKAAREKIDIRPDCVRCGRPWMPAEGVNAQITPCDPCMLYVLAGYLDEALEYVLYAADSGDTCSIGAYDCSTRMQQVRALAIYADPLAVAKARVAQ